MTVLTAILMTAGWSLAAFFGGYLAGRRVRPAQKRRKAPPPQREEDRLAAQARREWENFLNYEGMEQKAGP